MAVDTECIRVGTTIQSDATFTARSTGLPGDPTSVSVDVRKPNGTETTYTFGVDVQLERLDVGDYRLLIVPDMPGRWWFVWKAASPLPGINATGQDSVLVEGAVT